jgi:triosephosphate isomerase
VFLENAVGILKQPNVNGLFLARSGLESESFIEIIGAVRSAGLA